MWGTNRVWLGRPWAWCWCLCFPIQLSLFFSFFLNCQSERKEGREGTKIIVVFLTPRGGEIFSSFFFPLHAIFSSFFLKCRSAGGGDGFESNRIHIHIPYLALSISISISPFFFCFCSLSWARRLTYFTLPYLTLPYLPYLPYLMPQTNKRNETE